MSTVNRVTYPTYDIRVCIIIWNYEKDTKRKEKESKGGEYHQYFLFFQFSPPATKNHHDPPRPTTTRNDTPRKTSKVEAKVKERDKRRRIIKKDPTRYSLSLLNEQRYQQIEDLAKKFTLLNNYKILINYLIIAIG